ncbi:DEAD/DEAH box helicase [Patescibacteria group bacterium]|nr:DEAD/DEAH box helicase [Patescibacteria group bacterium]
MEKNNHQLNEILIVSANPYFLERELAWYSQNYDKIKNAARSQIWWKDNTLFLEKDLRANLYEVLRKITEFGYNKVQTLGAPGDFAQRGGILDIFPINSPQAWRLEFSGNKIEQIKHLPVEITRSKKAIERELKTRQPQDLLYNLKPNDFLVHLDHGIGVFLGFAQQPGGEISTELPTEQSHDKFFVLEYAKGDRLYVPLNLEEKLSRYIGFEKPIVHRLGGTLWFKTKRQAKENAIALTQELLSLYAHRAALRGFQYSQDDHLQKELEADFQFVETDDQAAAIAQVKKDMESPKPMDRLICGDVGFGKTEVALRAAFKAMLAGKQVALLAPTTILANQHYQNFEKRLGKFPVRLALLTRLQNKKEQKKIIKGATEGKIDIIIGTHRLLSKDIVFKNLGLAIIDEEQRFGVRQKEKFKALRTEADILSLTATPIPRTMHLTLSGLRDISIINTPPPGRLPIKTFIQPFNMQVIKETIERELKRDGQVYYLHNRVETIELAAKQIQKMFFHPSRSQCHFESREAGRRISRECGQKNLAYARDPSPAYGGVRMTKKKHKIKIAAIHGRLPEKQLVKIMSDFGTGEINVLVATTIIENGLDFPNVNTLIVANATRLGLAQAYQIRGRIGRSHQQAYAYFLYNAKHLTDEASQRLQALKEAEALGSGYQIALRDLEIRGAGNILGREQSGPINAVGLNLYMQMLNEAVEEMKK